MRIADFEIAVSTNITVSRCNSGPREEARRVPLSALRKPCGGRSDEGSSRITQQTNAAVGVPRLVF